LHGLAGIIIEDHRLEAKVFGMRHPFDHDGTTPRDKGSEIDVLRVRENAGEQQPGNREKGAPHGGYLRQNYSIWRGYRSA
jgi:hypothetical protein